MGFYCFFTDTERVRDLFVPGAAKNRQQHLLFTLCQRIDPDLNIGHSGLLALHSRRRRHP